MGIDVFAQCSVDPTLIALASALEETQHIGIHPKRYLLLIFIGNKQTRSSPLDRTRMARYIAVVDGLVWNRSDSLQTSALFGSHLWRIDWVKIEFHGIVCVHMHLPFWPRSSVTSWRRPVDSELDQAVLDRDVDQFSNFSLCFVNVVTSLHYQKGVLP